MDFRQYPSSSNYATMDKAQERSEVAIMVADADTIVVGVDGSEYSDAALRWAIGEADRSGRSLVLVNVWHWSSDALSGPVALFGSPDSRTAGHNHLKRAARLARTRGVKTQTRLLEGTPARGLCAVSEGAAMLVIGSHGYRGLRTALLGSVSRACLQRAACPVVIVGPQPVERASSLQQAESGNSQVHSDHLMMSKSVGQEPSRMVLTTPIS
jgi:nucleotide-binding universal stress UspA family protein